MFMLFALQWNRLKSLNGNWDSLKPVEAQLQLVLPIQKETLLR